MKFRTKAWFDDHATVSAGTYNDGSIKLTVRGRYGQIVCDPTINLAQMGHTPAPGNVFVMNYDDYEGAVTALQDAGIVGRTVRIIETSTHTRDPLQARPVHECPIIRGNRSES